MILYFHGFFEVNVLYLVLSGHYMEPIFYLCLQQLHDLLSLFIDHRFSIFNNSNLTLLKLTCLDQKLLDIFSSQLIHFHASCQLV